jgi:hypothetical protein
MVAHLTKAALQKRAASFTIPTAARHLRKLLDDKLLQLEMVYASGLKKGQTRPDSMSRRGNHIA